MTGPIVVVMRNNYTNAYKGYNCFTTDEAFAVAENKGLGDLAAVFQLKIDRFIHIEFAKHIDVDQISEVIAYFKVNFDKEQKADFKAQVAK